MDCAWPDHRLIDPVGAEPYSCGEVHLFASGNRELVLVAMSEQVLHGAVASDVRMLDLFSGQATCMFWLRSAHPAEFGEVGVGVGQA